MSRTYAVFTLLVCGLLTSCSGSASSPGVQGQESDQVAPIREAFSLESVIEANAAVSQKLNLLARLRVGSDRAVEWYHPVPGVVVVSEVGPGTGELLVKSVRGNYRTASELFNLLAPDLEVPETLARVDADPASLVTAGSLAVERSLPVAKLTASDPTIDRNAETVHLQSGEATGAGNSSCDSSWWANTVCVNGWDHKACLLGISAVRGWCNDQEHTYTAVCSVSGTTSLEVGITENYDWYHDRDWNFSVPQGTYRYYSFVSYTYFWGGDDAFNMEALVNEHRAPGGGYQIDGGSTFHYLHLCNDD